MDFSLNPELPALKERVRAFVEQEVIPCTSTGKLNTKLREAYKNRRWDEAQSSQAVPRAL